MADITVRAVQGSTASNPNISTMRIAAQNAPGDWFDVVQDYREQSVLNGLSVLGGLGAVLSTVFAFFLGISLMQVVHRKLIRLEALT